MSEDFKLEVPGSTTADQLYDLHDKLQLEFVKQLNGEGGAHALQHLREKRKLSDKLINGFGLGYIPSGPAAMRDLIVKLQISLEKAADGGLLKRDARKTVDAFKKANKRSPENNQELVNFFLSRCKEDRFFYRDYHCIVPEERGSGALFGDWLVIPMYIGTTSGLRVGGFQLRSARPVEEIGKQGRYRNPVNTTAMTWNETLIGLAEEAKYMESSGEVVLCEGGFDRFALIAALEARYPEGARPAVVALGGIAVRGGKRADKSAVEQAGILAKIKSRRTVLFLDQDEKGTEAILSVGPRLSAMGQFVSVCRVEDGWEGDIGEIPKDAGELWEKNGADGVLAALDAGRKRGLISWAAKEIETKLAQSRFGGRSWERLGAMDQLMPVLATVPVAVREKAINRVAEVVALSPSLINSLVSWPVEVEPGGAALTGAAVRI